MTESLVSGTNSTFPINTDVMDSEKEGQFQESVLGTREFWEDSFRRDLLVYQQRYEIDDVWFGQESVDRIVNWLEESNTDKSASILDIGCGNGATLISLAENGFTNLYGVDYASAAIELATTIAKEENKLITFEVCDFLQDLQRIKDKNETTSNKSDITTTVDDDGSNKEKQQRTTTTTTTTTTTQKHQDTEIITRPPLERSLISRQFDICLDKGTYDAVCLNPIDRANQKVTYQQNVGHVCKDGGLFLLTSCNWTREELLDQFNSQFEVIHQIPTPTFQFGGKVGNRETVLVFKKKPLTT